MGQLGARCSWCVHLLYVVWNRTLGGGNWSGGSCLVFSAALITHIFSLSRSSGSLLGKKLMRNKGLKEILISSAIAPVVQKYRPTADELYKFLLQIASAARV